MKVWSLISSALLSCASIASAVAVAPVTNKCAKVNILFIGLPAYHPHVISQGYDPAVVDQGLKQQLQALVAAGYNTKEVWFGPEEVIDPLLESLRERKWDGIIIGFGIRGDPGLEATIHLEEIIAGLQAEAKKIKIMFNRSPITNIEAVTRNFGLTGCENKPGINYGEHIYCAPEVCSTAPPGWLPN
ncbi:hypothetical protein P389DRAFT_188279 [Cystobasidium minutum MCA 4210]|uniref:uncharacterized protein n=1 Tax=Cystobasidium minutum MCA 4210 TaxID=1397322 RepID=UPI0034CFCE18|eukprot:jgi/Rhomi1/188279/estExt_fgenesh1_pg.C_2_t20102